MSHLRSDQLDQSLGEYLLRGIDLEAFETVKDKVVIQLTSSKDQQVQAQNLACHCVDGITATYRIHLLEGKSGVLNIKVTNAMVAQWGLSIDKLHELALQNTAKIFPPLLVGLNEALFGIGDSEERCLANEDVSLSEESVYLLSNQQKFCGAASILLPGVMEMACEKIGADLYILPSSIHEVLLIPKDDNMSKRELGQMVRTINREQVPPEERLADCIYEFDRKDKKLHQVKESLPRREEAER